MAPSGQNPRKIRQMESNSRKLAEASSLAGIRQMEGYSRKLAEASSLAGNLWLADDFAIPPLEYYRGMWPSAFGWLCRFLAEARLSPKSEIQARRARHFIQTVGPRIRSEVWARFSRNLDGKLSCSAKDGREFCGKRPGFLQTNRREWPGVVLQKMVGNFAAKSRDSCKQTAGNGRELCRKNSKILPGFREISRMGSLLADSG